MSFLSAALLVCSNADPATVDKVVTAAEHAAVDPMPLLAIGCIESGLRNRNVLGVRACYASQNPQLGQADCVRIGVASWKNRLRFAKDLHHAFRRYNNSKHRYLYATRAVKIAVVIRRSF